MAGSDAFVAPAYDQRSLAEVVPAVATALGLTGQRPTGFALPDAPAYVVFLIDGLGHELLTRHAHAAPYLASLMREPGTAGVPSTTATSLTSLGTALTPGQHGLIGFSSRVPGTEQLLNHLAWDQDVDPREWQPHETAFGSLASAGVHVTTVSRRAFESSGLTVAGQRGAEFVGADKAGEVIAAVLASVARRPSLTYVYDGDLDWTGHKYGVASQAWRQQLTMLDAEAERLRDALDPGVRLLVVADHGMVDSPPSARIDVDALNGMRDGVWLVGGEARFRHLYCRGGAVDDVVSTWRGILGDWAEVLTRDEVIERGWFGSVEGRVRPRLGDVMVACRGDAAIISTRDFPYENTLVGLHGSLTREEMLIPVLLG